VDSSLIPGFDKTRRYGVMSSDDSKPGRTKRSAAPVIQPQRQGRSAGNTRADYSRITRDVHVSVRSFFLADQSQPDENHFVWAYRVKIENKGPEPVQLLRRTWQITDARGRTQHVHGAGVVGEQPVLEPGESFEYTSGTPLDTPSGFMVGAYHMLVPSSGENFDVAIPAFSLDSPHQSGRVH
jgi:ApaG protein